MSGVRRFKPDYRWEEIELLRYKAEESVTFKDVTRQLLFDSADLGCELRYFEVASGGHSTLERHQHTHAVLILRGHGRVLIHDRVFDIAAHDLVTIDRLTWHQFRAAADAPLGFLCMVNKERDRPQLPSDEELAALKRVPEVAAFLGQ